MRCTLPLVLASLSLLASCAVNREGAGPATDYVEIPNPMVTMSPNAPATIWVPRSSVESGVPRGGELVKKGYEKVVGGSEPVPQQPASPVAPPQQQAVAAPLAPSVPVRQMTAVPPSPASPAISIKSRIALLDSGEGGLLQAFRDRMKNAEVGALLDPSQTAFLAKYSTVSTQNERGAFAARVQQEVGATIVVYVSAPDQVAAGRSLQAEVYDGLGGVLVRTVTVTVPPFSSSDPGARDAALGRALSDLAEGVKGVVALLPWYGKVAAVEGDRAYVNAGREAGLRIGQQLKVYRGGKVVPGLGFAPGERVATLEILGFVGTNGAYGVVREGKGVQANDLVATE